MTDDQKQWFGADMTKKELGKCWHEMNKQGETEADQTDKIIDFSDMIAVFNQIPTDE
jgi:hypothetical protein